MRRVFIIGLVAILNALAVPQHFAQQFAAFGVQDLGPQRHPNEGVLAAPAGTVRAFPVAPALGFVEGVEAQVLQGVELPVCVQIDAAPVAAVTASRSTTRNELLAPEGYATVATTSRLDVDHRFIYEIHWDPSRA